MRIVNLTGHDLRLGNSAEQLPGSRHTKARVKSDFDEVWTVHVDGPPSDDIPVLMVTEKYIRGLPDPVEGTLYVVSGIVASAAMRDDVVAPGRVERVGGGRVTGCHAFLLPRRMG